MKEYLELFWVFIVIGSSTFGGGYSLLPILERELVKKRGWINMDEVMDYFSIAQVTPGVIAVNVSTFTGFKRKGFAGGIIATIAFIIPGISLMILVSLFFKRFADYDIINHAFTGIRIAVGALILATVIKLVKGFFKKIKTVIIFIITFVLSAVFSTSPVLIFFGASIAGLFLFPFWRKEHEAALPDKHDPEDS